jgi:hypothetical protein
MSGGSNDLIYVGRRRTISTYSFESGSGQGTFNVPETINGICSDANGNVFVLLAKDDIYEYAHGGTSPIAKLQGPAGNEPFACSSDRSTGNLAVTLQTVASYAPSVAIFKDATGSPAIYKSPDIGADPQCGYDASGDLFVTSGGNVGAWLAKGKTAMTTVTLSKTLGGVSHVQWDGQYFALQSFYTTHHNGEVISERVFRVLISKGLGDIADTIDFANWPEKVAGDSWIEGGTIVATPSDSIVFWKYPAGGKSVKVLRPPGHEDAIAVSTGS